ncbi:MAG: GNAT family N-acetyltransferase [Cyclonatronaceae bacterium]
MIEIIPFSSDHDALACAEAMVGTEPWITLGLTFDKALEISSDTVLERYVAIDGDQRAGYILINTGAQFPGYIKILCVSPGFRGKGIGRRLMGFAEKRIFREFPNIFLCVSSFNTGAQRFYRSLGFHVVGELTNYLIEGHSEILMRKTIGPRSGFNPSVGVRQNSEGNQSGAEYQADTSHHSGFT